MKNKMLDSLHSRFDEIEDKDFLVLATILDPRYKDNFLAVDHHINSARLC